MLSNIELSAEIGAQIRELRLQRGWSLEKLAFDCDMNAAFLGHVERGLRCPNVYTLYRICEGLQIGLDELFARVAQPADNTAVIRHISGRLAALPPEKAEQVADLMDAALRLMD